MPDKYTRSRAKVYRGYDDGDNGFSDPRARGGYRRNYVGTVVIAVVVVVLLVGIGIAVFALKGNNSPASGDNAGFTAGTPEASTPASTDLAPAATPDTASGDTADPAATETAEPGDTTAPENTSQSGEPDPSEPADTSQPDESATVSPADTPRPSDTPEDTSGQATSDIGPVDGTANVTDYLSLRSSASPNSSVLEKIPGGGALTVLAVNKNTAWLKVKYSGKTGYVPAKYVTIGKSGNNKVCTVTSDSVNVRSGAGTSNSLVGSLKNGDTVIVTAVVKDSNGAKWYKVAIGSDTGYVSAQYCRLSGS